MTATPPRVLVTAGAAGIGQAIAEAFLDSGAKVHVCDIDDVALADFRNRHRDATAGRTDVSDPEAVDAMFDDVLERQGGLDVLVNNAGVSGPTGPVESLSYEDWRHCLSVNLDGAFLCSRRAAAAMKAQGAGSIVNISSSAGLHGYPLRTPYAAAKWALIGLTKSMAMELGPSGIRVNAICPGSVNGPRMERVIERQATQSRRSPDEVRADYVRNTSLRTFVDAADIAAATLFLCSPGGARITGQALPVDGHTETLAN